MTSDADLDESLRLIRDSARGIATPGDTRRIRALRFSTTGFDRDTWCQICAMGWPGLRVPEAAGGSELSMRAYVALAEVLGEGLVAEPLIPAAIAAHVLRGPGLASLLGGETIVIPAWQESANTLGVGLATSVGTRANGQKCFVPLAAGGDMFLVAGQGGLALVAADAPGVRIERQPTQDGGHFGTVTFSDAPAEPVAGALEPALEEATLATAAMLLGVMERAFTLTLDYLRTREQFGRKIGSFQALQHRAADLSMQIALTRASVEAAAASIDAGSPQSRAAVSRAKARASQAAMMVTREAIQLHGGIGYTDEYDIGLYLRRAMVLANSFGGAATHRARFAMLAVEEDA
ncbi:MAG: acyl-CoA dehydrogenase family protein [Rhodospirillales bacterium]|nr:acyl-CoA dehydrogenase family protein [Rhodospirillales bacterium]